MEVIIDKNLSRLDHISIAENKSRGKWTNVGQSMKNSENFFLLVTKFFILIKMFYISRTNL